MKNFEINAKNTMEVITIEELLDNVATGKICLPEYQRPAVWTDEQIKLLGETVKAGFPYGVLTLAEITNEDGEARRLLIDGHQRRTALEKLAKMYDDKIDALLTASDQMARDGKPAEELAKIDELIQKAMQEKTVFLASDVVLEVAKLSIPEAATMFVRLNNGKALSGIQKGTAKIDSKTLAKAREYIHLLPMEISGKKAKDEVALMLAAGMVNVGNRGYNCKNMATSGAIAVRVLELADAVKLANAGDMAESCKAFTDAVENAGRQSEWFTASRLVPAMVAGYIYHITRNEWDNLFTNYGKVLAYKCRIDSPAKITKNKGVECVTVNTCKTKDGETFDSIWKNVANGPAATLARFSSLRDVFRPTADRIKGHPLVNAGIAPVEENAEELEETANAMAEMFNA